LIKTKIAIIAMALLPYSALADEAEDCMTEALYFEARSEGPVGMLAVANVILQRVKSPKFPNHVCSVVHDGYMWGNVPVRDACAFSYWCDGKSDKVPDNAIKLEIEYLVILALEGATVSAVEGATHYHAWYVNPGWKGFIARIGNHLFYKGVE